MPLRIKGVRVVHPKRLDNFQKPITIPHMKTNFAVENPSGNMVVINGDNGRLLMSYGVPVAVLVRKSPGASEVRITGEFHSKTTSKHINKFLSDLGRTKDDAKVFPQDWFDGLNVSVLGL
jgi:hypothetical protein